jgi:hypothetical protein
LRFDCKLTKTIRKLYLKINNQSNKYLVEFERIEQREKERKREREKARKKNNYTKHPN